MKQFYQCDVADDDSDSIWTGPVVYTESIEEAEFRTMLELQRDWGDGYVSDAFIDAFGPETSLVELETGKAQPLPVFPGVEAWRAARYWQGISATTGMLTLDPLTALAKLGKIVFDVPGDVVDAVMRDEAKLHVVVDMSVVADLSPRKPLATGKIITNIDGKVTMPAHVWDRVLSTLDDNSVAWEGEESSVKEEHAELIEELESLGHYLAAHGERERTETSSQASKFSPEDELELAPGRPCECLNCMWNGGESELNPIRDFHSRVEAGDTTVPAGECPECGCLAYLKDDETDEELLDKAEQKHDAQVADYDAPNGEQQPQVDAATAGGGDE